MKSGTGDRLLLVTDKRMYGFTGLRSESSRFNTTFAGLRSVFPDTANNPVSGMQSMQILIFGSIGLQMSAIFPGRSSG